MNRRELAEVLRRARGRLSPADVGLPAGGRRRVAGLRREEVAQLAGVSSDYVVRLEQARGPQPSPSVLGALARALRLSDDERDELFHLAGTAPPLPGRICLTVRSSVQRLLDRMADLPVMVISAKGDIVAWNPLAAALVKDWSEVPAGERNIIWQQFLGDDSRVVLDAEQRQEALLASVGTLRTSAARYPHDPGLARLLRELRSGSQAFRDLWNSGAVTPWRSRTKTIDHPTIGPIVLECDSLQVPADDQTVIVYSAEPGSSAAEALELLRVVGLQRMTADSRPQ
ncbi:helix-turn-helix transcriptional regulator [Nakamurella lactea]|uniref:helix-turn-helix transcriptional regulator n=1 Tax=Nakamurella lactea TaxID=459515 RepID=UPI00040BB261|nr:helix-turn-helix transcriptional regulator [Nakamurella lactea]